MTVSKYTQALLACAVLLGGCAEPDEPASDSEIAARYGEVGTTSTSEPIDYVDEPYDFTGPTAIADVDAMIPSFDFVWYGTSPDHRFPNEGACDSRGNEVNVVEELPAEIEGIVTLHPRLFIKPSYCGSDERYYGAYFIEDASGGIIVLKDSRIADFTFGDRVKLRVLGLMKHFGTRAVVAHDSEEVVSRGHGVYYEDRESGLLRLQDIGKTVRFRGEVAGVPTNQNFNELCLVPEGESHDACDPQCIAIDQCDGYVLVSIDRELGQRNPRPLEIGDVITVTGPVTESFGLRILVSHLGQFEFIEE